jgi:hypothetical protein
VVKLTFPVNNLISRSVEPVYKLNVVVLTTIIYAIIISGNVSKYYKTEELMFCSNCGKENPDNAKFCASCGTPFTGTPNPQNAAPPQPQYTPPPPQPQYTAQPVAAQHTSGMAIASLILSIVGFSLFGIIFGGIALGQIGKNPNLSGKGLAIAGLIIGIIGFIAEIIWIIAIIIIAAGAGLGY